MALRSGGQEKDSLWKWEGSGNPSYCSRNVQIKKKWHSEARKSGTVSKDKMLTVQQLGKG